MRKNATWFDGQRSFAARAAGPLSLMLALFYLGFHAVSGERGLLALVTESHRLQVLKEELADVQGQRQTLEHKVQRLSSRSLDLDLLDEQVKRVLGMTRRDEIVYFPESQSPPNGGVR